MTVLDDINAGNLIDGVDTTTDVDITTSSDIVQVAQNSAATTGVGNGPDNLKEIVITLENGSIARLPAGTDISNPQVNGADLQFVQPDGSIIVITNGAVTGLVLFLGDIEIPAETVAALFTDNNIKTAAGPGGGADGAHGDFSNLGPQSVGDGIEFGSLLSDTGSSGETTLALGPVLEVQNIAPETNDSAGNAPVLDLDADDSVAAGTGFTATFTEGGAGVAIADTDTVITDADDTNIESMTITITNILDFGLEMFSTNFSSFPPGMTIIVSGPGAVTFTGSATLAVYQAIIESIQYNNTSRNPTEGVRTITVVVNDGDTDSNIAVSTINVVAMNDAPVIDLDANDSTTEAGTGFTATFTEDGGGVAIADTDTVITDANDTHIESATITLTNASDGAAESLTVTNASGLTVTNNGTGTVTITGSATLAVYQDVIESIRYNNTSLENPTAGVRIINVVVNDGDIDSNIAVSRINVVLANDAPVLDLDADDSVAAGTGFTATFTEGGAAVAIADTDIVITDVDDTNIESMTITFTNALDGATEFLFSTLILFPVPGMVATVSGPGAITVTGSATLAVYQTIIESIQYVNTSENPTEGARTITVVVNDGDTNSNIAVSTINVVAVNDAPVIDLDADNAGTGFTATFTEGGNPIAITDTDTVITDVDDTNIESATITLTIAPDGPNEILTVTNALGLTVTNNGTGTVTITGSATLAIYQSVIESIQYNNLSLETPSFGPRTITVVVNDGTTDSNIAVSTINVVERNGENSTPVIDLDANDSTAAGTGFTAIFTENGGAVAIADTDTVITDNNDTDIESATITLTNASDGAAESLTVANALGLTVTNNGTGTVMITGSATLAIYQSVIESIQYNNTSENPTAGARTIRVVVNDGNINSNVAVSTITVVAVNDAPTLTGLDNVTFPESVVNAMPQIIDANIVFNDVDSADLDTGTLTVSGFINGEDTIGINNVGTGAGQISIDGTNVRFGNVIIGTFTGGNGANNLVITFNAASTPEAVDALLQNLTYANSSDEPTADRTLTITVTDGDGGTIVANTVVSVMAEADTIDLTTLTPTQGFIIQGDATDGAAGYSVSSAGDINGDGFDDLIVGTPFGGDGGEDAGRNAGNAYVVFGSATGFGTTVNGRQVIDLTNLTPTQGFIIHGDEKGDWAGRSVSSAGDVNGDGFDDVIVGARFGGDGGSFAGESYVVFGTDTGFGTTIAGRQVIDLTNLTPTQGFIIQGDVANDFSGESVSSAGDINGDGFDDLIIGAPRGDDGGGYAGEAYVVFGSAAGFGVDVGGRQVIDLTTLNAAQGFIIQGDVAGDRLGYGVSSAGDVNGDGFDDLIVGAPRGDDGGQFAGEAYVVFGSATEFGTADANGRQMLDLTNLTTAQGFIIQGDAAGDQTGFRVSSAGDVNGDGFDDLIVGARYGDDGGTDAGEAYVVFGTNTGFGTAVGGRQVIDLSNLTAAQGFIIRGDVADDYAGWSVSSAGDVNGDGFDDLIVGARGGDDGGTGAGEAYVVFGTDTGFGTTMGGRQVLDLTNLTGAHGFIIQGDVAGDRAGFSVSSAGDVNGDGFDDLIIGATNGDDGGTNVGEAYVLFGGAFGAITVPVVNAGTNGNDILLGSLANDTLGGNGGGADVIRSGAGDDILIVGNAGFARIDGGTGRDTLRLDGTGINLDLTTILPSIITDIEVIDLTGTGNNTLTLSKLDVFDITTERSNGTAILTVNGNAGDTVTFADAGWAKATVDPTVTVDGITYNRYINGNAEVRIEVNVTSSVAGDPIILDLGGDGFEFSGSVAFDLDADGVAETLTNWVGSEDGLLVMDLDGSGQIENGSEVVSPNLGDGGHFDSLDALRSLDSNGDGILDASDLDFDKLQVWQDVDSDGITDTGELSSLAKLGIESIDLNAELVDFTIDDTQVLAKGTATLENGNTLDFLEVSLSNATELEGFLEDPAGDEYDLSSLLNNAFAENAPAEEEAGSQEPVVSEEVQAIETTGEVTISNDFVENTFEVITPVDDLFG